SSRRTVPSELEETTRLPSGENATPRTLPAWSPYSQTRSLAPRALCSRAARRRVSRALLLRARYRGRAAGSPSASSPRPASSPPRRGEVVVANLVEELGDPSGGEGGSPPEREARQYRRQYNRCRAHERPPCRLVESFDDAIGRQ